MNEKSKNVRKQLFSDSWLEDDRFKGWLRAIPDQPSKASCIACNLIFGTKKSDIIRHSESQRHIRSVSSLKNVTKLEFRPDSEIVKMRTQVQKTELMLAHFVACHNLSFRSIDHLSQLPSLIMNDSKISKQISLKRTKCIKLIKNVLASVVVDNIVKEIENKKFSVYLDETTDIANIKVLAILVKYISNNQIQTHLLDLVPVDANHGTAKGLYMLFSKSLDKLKLSTDNIIGYCADNASVMMGSKESFKVHLLNDNSNIIVNGCICHSFHLIASSAASCIPSNIEILLQNISSYFSRSPKRQSVLKELQRYLNESQLKILSPSQTRWLALDKCVERVLSQWRILNDLFRLAYVEEKNPAANVIYQELQNPYTKAYLCFLHFILPVFNTFNALFQSEKPLVFILYEESVRFLRIMCSKFLKAECYKNDEFDKFKNPSMILPNNDIEIGHEARKILTSCYCCLWSVTQATGLELL
ncbi:uncharacterized protein LOC111026609 [Myzus persicae]|uniref:uncharacterized protein LOC111026609 n=1 Tax=Myzus persicae TaxID=13164 RepID=UPI000B935891|nr:uncharacterized protein LOC111026609 [Myzus persicae]